MAKFPELSSIAPANPESVHIQWKTLISSFDDLGYETRKQKWLYPRRNIILQFVDKSIADGRSLWQFYLSRKGTHEAFNYFFPFSNIYTFEYVGTGDGATVIFNLPAKTSSSYTVYKNAVAQSGGGVDYTFAGGGGTDGADKITFVAAPDAGDRITYSFTGILKVHCRFAKDDLTYETLWNDLVGVGIELIGLLNE